VWGDGVAVDDASVDCSAKVGGVAVPDATVTLVRGTFTCGWNVSNARAGRLVGSVTVTDSSTGVKASRLFSMPR
jgi:hypothetical protein